MSEYKITDPINDESDPRWAELRDWIENEPIGTFRGGDLPNIEKMDPNERAEWHNQNCRPVFSTPCPDWCTITARGLRHEDDLIVSSGASLTSHTDDGFDVGSRDHVCLVREDMLLDGIVTSREFVLILGTDRAEATVADLLSRADALRLAAGKYADMLVKS